MTSYPLTRDVTVCCAPHPYTTVNAHKTSVTLIQSNIAHLITLGPFDLDQVPVMLHENIHSPKSNTKARCRPGSSNVARTPSGDTWRTYINKQKCAYTTVLVFSDQCVSGAKLSSTTTNIIQTNLIITNRMHPRRPSFTLRTGPGSWKLNVYIHLLSWL